MKNATILFSVLILLVAKLMRSKQRKTFGIDGFRGFSQTARKVMAFRGQ